MLVLRKYHGGGSAMYKVEKNEKIGEYIGKIYMESKKRPKFIIDKFLKK